MRKSRDRWKWVFCSTWYWKGVIIYLSPRTTPHFQSLQSQRAGYACHREFQIKQNYSSRLQYRKQKIQEYFLKCAQFLKREANTESPFVFLVRLYIHWWDIWAHPQRWTFPTKQTVGPPDCFNVILYYWSSLLHTAYKRKKLHSTSPRPQWSDLSKQTPTTSRLQFPFRWPGQGFIVLAQQILRLELNSMLNVNITVTSTLFFLSLSRYASFKTIPSKRHLHSCDVMILWLFRIFARLIMHQRSLKWAKLCSPNLASVHGIILPSGKCNITLQKYTYKHSKARTRGLVDGSQLQYS